jgi:hypothetical protein
MVNYPSARLYYPHVRASPLKGEKNCRRILNFEIKKQRPGSGESADALGLGREWLVLGHAANQPRREL